VVERLVDWAKAKGITTLLTSLLDDAEPTGEGSAIQVSTIADTWIHLSYLVKAGERNRGLTIIKSRGTAHSNQVRELLLGDEGVSLAEVYQAEGEVLMGSMRLQREQSERAEQLRKDLDARWKQLEMEAEKAELEDRLKNLQAVIRRKESELQEFQDLESERRSLDEQQSRDRRAKRQGKPEEGA